MINIMGSPGAGKTTFILNLIDELKEMGLNVAVIEGDIDVYKRQYLKIVFII